jgi:RecB family endonuclease NucS
MLGAVLCAHCVVRYEERGSGASEEMNRTIIHMLDL